MELRYLGITLVFGYGRGLGGGQGGEVLESHDGWRLYPPVMDRQRGLYCAKKDIWLLRWIHVTGL